MTDLAWIESGGGPLVFMAEEVRAEWRGQQPTPGRSDTTDYARACGVLDDVGVMPLGEAHVVVMGDEPDRTALLPHLSDVFILRWRWAPSGPALLSALMSQIDQMAFGESVAFRTRPGRHVLFDSACEGANPGTCLPVDLHTDHYSIGTALFAPSADICALVHRVRPRQGA